MRSVERDALAPMLRRPGPLYWLMVLLLSAAVIAGLVAWLIQLRGGLGVTGLNSQVMWGVYIVNFIFFVGISYAGTLLSAVLRLVGAEWRRPITRVAEIVTVVSLGIAALLIFTDLGRPLVAPINMFLFGQISAPFVWDLMVLSSYFVGALIFLYLPLIPDIARLRDHFATRGGLRHRVYRVVSLNWRGSAAQERRLERALAVLAISIIPLAVLAHSVVAWIFGVTVRPLWNSTIFAPYFVWGAVFSGTAVIIVVMALYRRFWGFAAYFTDRHFVNLGFILLLFNLGYMYFTFSEYLTIGYAVTTDYGPVLMSILAGVHAPAFWFAIIIGMIVPAIVVAVPLTRTVNGITFASVLVIAGMWLKRWIIVVPPQEVAGTPAGIGTYTPNLIEWLLTLGPFAALALAFLVFQRFFPVLAIWELEHGRPVASDAGAPAPTGATGARSGPVGGARPQEG
jgi:Ni/Fe-hydrogenase subunit HybB-like protein